MCGDLKLRAPGVAQAAACTSPQGSCVLLQGHQERSCSPNHLALSCPHADNQACPIAILQSVLAHLQSLLVEPCPQAEVD